VLHLDFAPLVLLAGQILDAIGNPLIGFLSDRTETRLGKRFPWYIGGVIGVSVLFLMLFH